MRQHSNCTFYSFFFNLCPNFPNKVKISCFLHVFSEWNHGAVPPSLPLVVEGWTLGLDQVFWIFAHLALTEVRCALLIPSAPKATKIVVHFGITCCKNPPDHFIMATEMQIFWAWFSFCLVGGRKSAIFLCKPFWKICCNKNLGFKSPGVCFDLGCPFYCSSFPVFDVWALHICGDFHRHVLCSDRRGCASGLKMLALGLSFD